MNKYRVSFSGEIEVEAQCGLEAECNAAFDCRPDNCRAILIGGDDFDPNVCPDCEEHKDDCVCVHIDFYSRKEDGESEDLDGHEGMGS